MEFKQALVVWPNWTENKYRFGAALAGDKGYLISHLWTSI